MTFGELFKQMSVLVGLPAMVIAGLLAAALVVVRDWRAVLLLYALFSAVLGLLLAQVIPTEWALLQVIAGGLVAVMLFLSARQLRMLPAPSSPRPALVRRALAWPRLASLPMFRVLAVAVAVVAFFAVRESIHLPLVSTLYRNGIVWLVMVGLLGMALHEEPMHAGLSLLIVLGAASLLLFTLSQRRMLIGIVEAGQVVLGLAIAYLALSHGLAIDEHPDSVELPA